MGTETGKFVELRCAECGAEKRVEDGMPPGICLNCGCAFDADRSGVADHSIELFDKARFDIDLANDVAASMEEWAKQIPDFPIDGQAFRELKVFDELEKEISDFPHGLVELYGENFYDEILRINVDAAKLATAEVLRLGLFEAAGNGNGEKGCGVFIQAYLTNKSLYKILYRDCQIFREFMDGIAPKYQAEFQRGRNAGRGLKIFRAILSMGGSLITDAVIDAAVDGAFRVKSKGAETANDPLFKQMIFIFIESRLWKV